VPVTVAQAKAGCVPPPTRSATTEDDARNDEASQGAARREPTGTTNAPE
jgi:hypothetical protein